MLSKTFSVPAIDCEHCVATVKREVSQIQGVARVEGDHHTQMVTVDYENESIWDQVRQLLDEIGYPPAE
ncbi:MAG: heavy-metal-associated domain-containing protein [Chloroflexi bacterium]|nr:heavy-metal-associated domain-containing protein [Chloroflexota bacterium]